MGPAGTGWDWMGPGGTGRARTRPGQRCRRRRTWNQTQSAPSPATCAAARLRPEKMAPRRRVNWRPSAEVMAHMNLPAACERRHGRHQIAYGKVGDEMCSGRRQRLLAAAEQLAAAAQLAAAGRWRRRSSESCARGGARTAGRSTAWAGRRASPRPAVGLTGWRSMRCTRRGSGGASRRSSG